MEKHIAAVSAVDCNRFFVCVRDKVSHLVQPIERFFDINLMDTEIIRRIRVERVQIAKNSNELFQNSAFLLVSQIVFKNVTASYALHL